MPGDLLLAAARSHDSAYVASGNSRSDWRLGRGISQPGGNRLGAARADFRESRHVDGRQQSASALPDLAERVAAEYSAEVTGFVPGIPPEKQAFPPMSLSS